MEKDVCKLSVNKNYCYMFWYPGFIYLDRVGSEFWNQQVRIGNDVTGIK